MITKTTETMTAPNSYLRDFTGADSRQRCARPGRGCVACAAAAAERFAAVGFPTRRNEEWRFTNVSPIVETPFTLATQAQSRLTTEGLRPYTYEGMGGTQLVFVNGHFHADLSSAAFPSGVVVSSLASAMAAYPDLVEAHLGRSAQYDTQAFVALNTAALEDGAFVHIKRGVVVDEPIHLLFVSTPEAGPTVPPAHTDHRRRELPGDDCRELFRRCRSGLLHQCRHRSHCRRERRPRPLQSPARKPESLPCRHDAASDLAAARTSPATPSRSAACLSATTPTLISAARALSVP